MNYKIVNNILTPNLIKYLKTILADLRFEIGKDTSDNENIFGKDVNTKGMMCCTSLDKYKDELISIRLNDFGFIITEIVCKKLNLNVKQIKRIMWNYYTQNEVGSYHCDHDQNNHYSILYSLNTSDGYIEISDEKIYDIEDEAKIFKSNLKHRGVGPIKTKYRLNLIVLVEVNNNGTFT